MSTEKEWLTYDEACQLPNYTSLSGSVDIHCRFDVSGKRLYVVAQYGVHNITKKQKNQLFKITK